MLLDKVLCRIIREGQLVVRYADGAESRFGEPDNAADSPLTICLHDPSVAWQLALDPDPTLGEGYMDGRITFENGGVWEFLELIGRNLSHSKNKNLPLGMSRAFGFILRTIHQLNPASKARKNIAHHYDLSGALYDLFLDRDRQYSCAYFPTPETGLDAAQEAKKSHIIRKLLLRPGDRVLDIGCGWGGTALSIAHAVDDAKVLGITLSEEQLGVARWRAEKAGVSDRVRFELLDYRNVDGQFDRIVSIGMFEHVGVPHYPAYFAKVAALLKEDGVALLHSIGRNEGPGITSPFIRKYIFPGGYIPGLSEVIPHVERSGLWTTDIEILRLHYALTLRHWRERFCTNWEAATGHFDERFCRMWEFYLAGSEMSFRYDTMMVFQLQMAKCHGPVPITRDYLYS